MSKGTLSKHQVGQVVRQQLQQVQISHYSGPLPQPEALEKYEQIVPGSAQRIIAQFEKQAEHRQTIEKTAINSNSIAQIIGSISGAVIGVGGVGGGLYLTYIGKDTSGLTALLGSLASLVAVYIVGKVTQQKERENKR